MLRNVVEPDAAVPTSQIWEAAIDSMEPAALVLDPYEDRIRQFNDAALKLTGLEGFALLNTRPSKLFGSQLAELTGFTLECLTRGRAWSTDLSINRTDGTVVDVEVFASSFRQGASQYVLLACYDLRAQRTRRAEAEMNWFYRSGLPQESRFDAVFRDLERGNQLILNALGEGVYGVDAHGVTTFVNPAAERMLGWRAEELIGRSAHAYMHHSHEDGTAYPTKACPIYAAFRDGRVHRVSKEVFWRKDGSSFPVEYTSTPIQEKGRLLGAVVVFRDVSLQRKAQADLIRALEEVEALKKRLEMENAYLQDELRGGSHHKEIVGDSPAVHTILRQVELVAPTTACVLITGESGTGKELIARAIHDASPRRERPLIRVNCASIPRELFESEFFGHVKGAFTGALAERIGRFELADGGTLFLDEVGELPLEHQAKLLRVLQEQRFERVGESRTRSANVRLIAATNRDLKAEVAQKRFREDLYFRLNVFPVEAPPLRDRLDDIPVLATLFLRRASARADRKGLQISLADVERLRGYHWPGNIRELENVIERAAITAVNGRLRFDLPQTLSTTVSALQNSVSEDRDPASTEMLLTEADRKALEVETIRQALRTTKGRVSGAGGAAELLGLKPTTLYSRLQRFAIDARSFKE